MPSVGAAQSTETHKSRAKSMLCVHGFCSGWNKQHMCSVQVADGWHRLFQNPLGLHGWREVRGAKMVIMASEQIAVYPERCFVSIPGP